MAVHHMWPGNSVPMGHQTYAQQVKSLAQQLEQLNLVRGVRIVWMVNQPILDSAFFDHKVNESYTHLNKVVQYNKVARSIISSVILFIYLLIKLLIN